MVGGATPSRIASTEKIASTTPAAPRRCPVIDLVELTAARFLGGVVARGERLRLAEAAETAARGGHFPAARDDEVGVAVLNGAHAEPDGVRRGGAGGDHAEIRALQAKTDREMTADHVDDGGGHEERRDPARAHPLQVLAVFRLDGAEAADARAADRAAARGIGLGKVDARVVDGLHPGGHAVLQDVVHAAGLLRLDVLADVEVAHRPADAHRECGHVEARHRSDAALPAEDGVPGRLHGAPDRGHHAKTRYDDTALAHTIPVWRLIESGLAAALVDVVDGLVDGGDLLGILVRDFDLELLLEGHHQLDRVERIRSQVVDERGIVRYLFLLHAQLFGNDGFDLLLNSAH